MSKQAIEEENKKLNRVEEKLKELSKCGLFLDNIFIKDKTARQILVSAYNKLERQQKEIEEKTTIIMAGAEKVKQLEKEIKRLEKDNDTLSELVIVNEDKVIKELDLISKDKIREAIKNREIELYADNPENNFIPFDKVIDTLKELLEEN